MKNILKKIFPQKVINIIRIFIMKCHKKKINMETLINLNYQNDEDFIIINKRKAIYNSSNISFTVLQKKLIYELTEKGFFFGKLNDYYNKSEELITHLTNLANPVKGLSFDNAMEINSIEKETYRRYSGGDYMVNLYHSIKDIQDPIKSFLTDPKIFTMAARYLGEIPQIMMIDFFFTPKNTNYAHSAMLWHLDLHHKNTFRMFINPFDMKKINGATKIFPKKYSERNNYQTYPYFTNEQAVENGFDMDDVVHLTGKSGMLGVTDTCQNFHCGSNSKEERFIAIFTYVPYLYNGDYNADSLRGNQKLFQRENKIIYDYFVNN
jgi:hypothetical protein